MKVKCPKCAREFKSENGLQDHMKAVHPSIPAVERARRAFQSLQSLQSQEPSNPPRKVGLPDLPPEGVLIDFTQPPFCDWLKGYRLRFVLEVASHIYRLERSGDTRDIHVWRAEFRTALKWLGRTDPAPDVAFAHRVYRDYVVSTKFYHDPSFILNPDGTSNPSVEMVGCSV